MLRSALNSPLADLPAESRRVTESSAPSIRFTVTGSAGDTFLALAAGYTTSCEAGGTATTPLVMVPLGSRHWAAGTGPQPVVTTSPTIMASAPSRRGPPTRAGLHTSPPFQSHRFGHLGWTPSG